MNEIVSYIVSAIPSGALPIVVLLLGFAYLYFKFGKVEKDREKTKTQRDQDSESIHDQLLRHEFKIAELSGIVNLHKDKLDSIDKQLGIVNQELVKLNVQVEHLATALEKQNEIMMRQINGVNNGK